ncbi:hypothetical protein OG756_35390 [Streptomyces sp. NBC_01310]|uniref:hypothetical protein n=1 Tax=Streptomyces sp. NBC_01310 TaxID=2903820 RepID=UPI0035B5C19A|nr:hypothetical protein OG756_35390 [Streptomyces sp. NBC_01310]
MPQDDTWPATEPHVPTSEERAARDRVRQRATGMTHHQSAEALKAAEKTSGNPETDTGLRAEIAEWQRITDLLYDHGGPYTPETDA